MADGRVWIFFYGTFMDPAVLRSEGLQPAEFRPARLNGYEIQIKARANLAKTDRSVVYGSIVRLTHDEIAALYQMLSDRGLVYLPEPVVAETLDGALRPALCYIAPHLEEATPDKQYVSQLVEAIKAVGLPEWYSKHVASFAPQD